MEVLRSTGICRSACRPPSFFGSLILSVVFFCPSSVVCRLSSALFFYPSCISCRPQSFRPLSFTAHRLYCLLVLIPPSALRRLPSALSTLPNTTSSLRRYREGSWLCLQRRSCLFRRHSPGLRIPGPFSHSVPRSGLSPPPH